MPDGGLIEWFSSLSLYRQVFVVLFTLLVAMPIVTLTILQLFESLGSLRRPGKTRSESRDKDGD